MPPVILVVRAVEPLALRTIPNGLLSWQYMAAPEESCDEGAVQ